MRGVGQVLIDGQWAPELVVGLIHDGRTEVIGFGGADGDTVFEIGSVTKVFTSMLLAEAVKRGEVTLDQPIAGLVPEGVKAPGITLRQLATHTSGLPRLPDNMEPADPGNPYADYGEDRLWAFLGSVTLGPREEVYSNVGAGLLGVLLARRAGKSYEALVAERITGPLGMTSTGIAFTPEMKARLAPGHDPAGEPAENWDLGALAGAGAIRSTANDMLKLVAAEMDVPPVLAWQHDGPVVWHNGETGGYHSWVAFDPVKRVGVVVLASSAVRVIDVFGQVLMLMVRGQPYTLKLPGIVPVTPDVLDRYVGSYTLVPGFVMTITRDGDKLFVQATGQPRFRLYPESDTHFYLRAVDAQIDFQPGGLVLHQNGRDMPAPKGPP